MTSVMSGLDLCVMCGGPNVHVRYGECIGYLKSENHRLSKLLTEAIQVRDAARVQSNKDLEEKRRADLEIIRLENQIKTLHATRG